MATANELRMNALDQELIEYFNFKRFLSEQKLQTSAHARIKSSIWWKTMIKKTCEKNSRAKMNDEHDFRWYIFSIFLHNANDTKRSRTSFVVFSSTAVHLIAFQFFKCIFILASKCRAKTISLLMWSVANHVNDMEKCETLKVFSSSPSFLLLLHISSDYCILCNHFIGSETYEKR